MYTSIESIFKKFLGQIDDYELLLLEEDILEEVLFEHFENALATFQELKGDFEIIPPRNEEFVLEELDIYGTSPSVGSKIRCLASSVEVKEAKVENEIEDKEILALFGEADNTLNINNKKPKANINTFFIPKYLNDKVPFELCGEITSVPYYLNKDYEIFILNELGGALVVFYNIPVENVKIRFDFQGYLNMDLTKEEVYIIVQGMVLSWLQTKINREENLRNYVSDRDLKFLSSANMLDKLLLLDSKTRKNYNLAKQRYAFKNFEGWN